MKRPQHPSPSWLQTVKRRDGEPHRPQGETPWVGMCEKTGVTRIWVYHEPCSRFPPWTRGDLTRGLTHFLICTWQVELDWTGHYISTGTPHSRQGIKPWAWFKLSSTHGSGSHQGTQKRWGAQEALNAFTCKLLTTVQDAWQYSLASNYLDYYHRYHDHCPSHLQCTMMGPA